MTMQWSPAKEEVFRLETDIVVSAGAGSGKTAALVELYLRLLAGETSLGRALAPEQIVAITFTDKAAAEMKERVRSGIRKRYEAGDRKADWQTLQRSLSQAPISTFHSFCSSLLRENAAEAGIDPSFELLDDYRASAELEAALDELVREGLKSGSEELCLLLTFFPLSGRGQGKGLREHLIAIYGKRSTTGRPFHALRERMGEWAKEAERLFLQENKRLQGLDEEVRRVLAGREAAFHSRLRPLAGLLAKAPLDAADMETTERLGVMRSCIAGNWGKEKPVRDELTAALDTMLAASSQSAFSHLGLALISLLENLDRRYRLRKEQSGSLDFDDLLLKTRDLLARHPLLTEGYRRRFAVVMVDEFQDTNSLQKELVKLICGDGQRLFIVGDPKQSIYLFRGADVGVFMQTRKEVESCGGSGLYFQESFRSRPGVIRFVNELFSRIMAGADEHEVVYGQGDHLVPQRAEDGATCVELLSITEGDDAAAKRRIEARTVAAKIAAVVEGREEVTLATGEGAALVRAPRYRDIAVLFRRFSNIKAFERELRLAGIPYYVVKGKGFYQCQEVLDLLNALRYLEFGGDLVSLAGVLRSPLCGVTDETLYLLGRDQGLAEWTDFFRHGDPPPFAESWEKIDPEDRSRLLRLAALLRRLADQRDRFTLVELVEEIVWATSFSAILLATYQGEQKAANLRKFIDFSRTFTDGGGGLRSFILHMEKLVESEPTEAEAVIAAEDDDVVRLMTIHQSKGLEFPIVFIPEIGGTPPPDSPLIVYDDGLGIGLKVQKPGKEAVTTLAWQEIAALNRKKILAEQKRLFYVALTRARDYLVLSGEGRGEWRSWVDALAAEGKLIKTTEALPAKEEPISAESALPQPPVPSDFRRIFSYTPPLPASLVFSPTALEDYDHCPRKYYYKGVLGLDEGLFAQLLESREKRKKQQGLSPLEKGNLAHAMLQHLDFSSSAAEQRELCRKIAVTLAGTAAPEAAELVDEILAFADSGFGRLLASGNVQREYPFVMRLSGSADYYIKGTIDALLEDGNRLLVIDYKYLRKEDADIDGYRFQVATYLTALSRGLPGKRIEGRLVFLRGGETEPVTVEVETFAARLLAIMEEVRKRHAEEDFRLRKDCDGSKCPFRNRCQPQLKKGERQSPPQQLSLAFGK